MTMRIQKLIAALMLSLLLPATVFAASIRYCEGENGHWAIEFAHAKDPHAISGIGASAPSFDVALALRLAGTHCQDRLLLPEAAKPEACHSRPPRPEPGLPGYSPRRPGAPGSFVADVAGDVAAFDQFFVHS